MLGQHRLCVFVLLLKNVLAPHLKIPLQISPTFLKCEFECDDDDDDDDRDDRGDDDRGDADDDDVGDAAADDDDNDDTSFPTASVRFLMMPSLLAMLCSYVTKSSFKLEFSCSRACIFARNLACSASNNACFCCRSCPLALENSP